MTGRALDEHLQGCPACQMWFDDATRITSLARTGLMAPTPNEGTVGGPDPRQAL